MKLSSNNVKKTSFIFLLFSIVIGEIGRIHISGNIYISLLDLAALVFVLVNFSSKLLVKPGVLKTYLGWSLAVFFMMIFTLGLRIPEVEASEILKASLYAFRWLVYILIPFGLAYMDSDYNLLIPPYKIMFLSLAGIGFLQYTFLPNLGVLEQYGFDPHYMRLVSTWLDPNFFGPLCVLGFLIFLSNHTKNLKTVLCIIVMYLALLLTFSRSSYVLFTVAGMVYVIMKKSWKQALIVLAGIVILYTSFTIPRQNLEKSRNIDRVVSANSRLTSYSQGLFLFENNPIFGVGYNLVRYEKKQYGMISDIDTGGNSGAGIDSSWILMLATTGIVGFSIFFIYWIRVLYLVIDPVKPARVRTILSTIQNIFACSDFQKAFISFFVGWAAHTWFVNSLFFTPLLAVWGIGLGIALKSKISPRD